MKKVISLFIAAIIIGFACFAICYWVFSSSYVTSLSVGISSGAGGLAGEFLKSYLKKKKKDLQPKRAQQKSAKE